MFWSVRGEENCRGLCIHGWLLGCLLFCKIVETRDTCLSRRSSLAGSLSTRVLQRAITHTFELMRRMAAYTF